MSSSPESTHVSADAVLDAQETFLESGSFPELLSIYHLLGDPALRLRSIE